MTETTNRALQSALQKLGSLRDPSITEQNPKYDHLPVILERREGRALLERIDGLQQAIADIVHRYREAVRGR